MHETGKHWHLEAVSPGIAEAAQRLAGIGILQGFYLAGGTALALHLGHRRSVDLDFFTSTSFNEDALIASLQQLPKIRVLSKSPETVYALIRDTKVSFIGYQYPLLFPLHEFDGLAVADERDIACMKISALASRGSRRDFVDLYVLAKDFGLGHLLDLFQRKFAKVNYSALHIRKALTYFGDAEVEPMPDVLAPLPWQEVRAFFEREVLRLA